MTLEQLRALDAVVACGSIRAASGQLHKTAPAISSLIKNLESDLGIELLDRSSYRPVLTEQGEIVYTRARQVLRQADELHALSQRIAGRKEVLVNIAINAVCPLQVILATLRRLEERYPNTEINVSSEHVGGAMEKLRRQQADLVITTTHNIDTRQMEAAPLLDVAVIPVAHAQHPMSKAGRLVPRREAMQYTQVIVRDTSREGQKHSLDVVEGGRHCHVTDFAAKQAIIEAGLGWGGMPEYLVADGLRNGLLKALSVEGFEVRHSQQFLIRRTDGKQGPVTQDIWESLIGEFEVHAEAPPAQP